MTRISRNVEISDREVSITAVRRPNSIQDIDLTLRSAHGTFPFHVFYHEAEKAEEFERLVRFLNDNVGSRYDVKISVTPNQSDIISIRKTDVHWAARLLLSLNEDGKEVIPNIKFSFERETLGPVGPDNRIGDVMLYAYNDREKYNGHSVLIEVKRSASAMAQTLDPLL